MDMLDIDEFYIFLKSKNKSDSAIKRCIKFSTEFVSNINKKKRYKDINQITKDDLLEYIMNYEKSNKKANTVLWALINLFEYIQLHELLHLASELRKERIERKEFFVKDFMGVNPTHMDLLNDIGIKTVNQMLKAGKSIEDRKELAKRTGIPYESILEYVKLSDLSRIGAIKSKRARMFFDAGFETPEELTNWKPKQLRNFLVKWVQENNFPGIASLPKECEHTIEKAKQLESIVEYES